MTLDSRSDNWLQEQYWSLALSFYMGTNKISENLKNGNLLLIVWQYCNLLLILSIKQTNK